MHNKNEQITTDQVIQSYRLLASDDPELKHQANEFLMNLAYRDEAWQITQNMLNNVQDPHFQFLGAQILYQKISHELLALSQEARAELREFVFSKLQDTSITYNATTDKLASIAALIACISLLDTWPAFVQDMIGFMAKNQHNLKSGLFVFERMPEELRATSRIAVGLKNNILDDLLKHEKSLADIFMSVLNTNNNVLVKKCLQVMQSWAKSRFNFLRYTDLIKVVLIKSLESFQNFESGIVMVVQTIKGASSNRFSSSLSEWQPSLELTKYTPQQIESIKLIIQFIIENKNNFINTSNSVEAEHIDMYLQIIKNSLLSFGFLINEKIGFDMLDIIVYFTKSSDLRTSQGTFQFWMDFSDKMLKCKIAEEVKKHFATYVAQIFQIVSKKIKVDNESLLDDPDLKQDVTIDDINAMSFSEYRRESSTLYQYIYAFYLGYTGSPKYYFDKCFEFIGGEANGTLGTGTELALFCIKSAVESMLSPDDSEYICKILSFVISKGTDVYSRIVVEALFLIRDCTRQIKKNNELCLSALNYSLFFLKDEKICFYAADAFKILMQTLTTISDPSVVANMLQFYSTQEFPSDQIVDKVIEGIFATIVKLPTTELIGLYISQLVQIVLKRFQAAHQALQSSQEKPYLISLKEINTILENFDTFEKGLQTNLQSIYTEILAHGLKMVQITIPFCLKQKQAYVKFNELGLSCSIYKQTLRLCKDDISNQHIKILDTVLLVLNPQLIVEMCPVLDILCYTITYFIPKVVDNLNKWLLERLGYINGSFLTVMDPIGMADVDVIRHFYEIQESLILYNCQIYLAYNGNSQIFDLALYVLRHINQAKMQRKIITYLYLCCQIPQTSSEKYPKIIETVMSSIPIVNSLSHHNLSRILLLISPKLPNIQDLLYKALRSNPYDNLQLATSEIFLQLLMMIISPVLNISVNSRERNLMMLVKDLQEFAKMGDLPGKVPQLEFRLAMWKKKKMGADGDQ